MFSLGFRGHLMQNKIFLVDLDETLIKYNSFPRWIFFILYRSLLELNFEVLFNILHISILRKLRVYNHNIYKMKLMEIEFPDAWNVDFAKVINSKIRLDVVNLVEEVCKKSSCYAVVSSAAPINYIRHIDVPSDFFINACMGSFISDGGELFNNIGFNKYEQASVLKNNEVLGIFTDHYLDFSAIREGKIFVINPNSSTSKYIIDNNVDCDVFIFKE